MTYADTIRNMQFSDEERKVLKAQRDLVVKWIMDNIVPRIPKGEHILIDFGDRYKAPTAWDWTTEYHFGVYGEPHSFWADHDDNITGYVGFGELYGGLGHAVEHLKSPYDIFPIINNWKVIKQNLFEEVCRLEDKHSSIANFTI